MKIKFAAIIGKKAIAAVQRNGDALRYVPEATEGYKDVALAAVQKNGEALRHVLSIDLFNSIALELSIEVEV